MKTMKIGLAMLALSTAALTARADTLAYAATDTDFGTLDLNTGMFHDISSLPTTFAGLADVNGNLYGAELYGGNLYKINPTTGAAASLGSNSVGYYDFGSTTTGLYALDENGNLFSINATNGAVIKDIGNLNLGTLGIGALSDNSGMLYLLNAPSTSVNVSSLYSINTANASVSLISSSVTGNEFAALLATNNTLYGVSDSIYTIGATNGAEGAGVAVSNLSGAAIYGLAPDPLTPVPLPRSVVLLLSGVALFVAIGRRRRPIGDAEQLLTA